MQPQAVIFDIGNVLIGWQPEAYYDAQIGPTRRQAFFDAVPIHAVNLEIDRGAPFLGSLQELAGDYPDWRDEILGWHKGWLQMVQPVIEESVATLLALKAKGVPVFALTNFGDETFEIALKAFPFLHTFDRAFVSARLRLIKPDPAIYAHVEAVTGLKGDQILFTDDRPENIAAAAERGWQTHLFTGWRAWAQQLVATGLLTEKEAGL
ncbi:HAD family phosphatase [Xinfangfangia sp. CPCC 101601]|uniref:HAD family phosphatase n=1 Tax=Pseudogemmobacter lacusdianii TaxID=3069608 RepID=A0ABU0VYJ6_9RHOB|nr:HAD family phosphatase [Xinfangfangia sp. CPCC 101601]MDQ2066837.1 HAD family phosphatase [Xinfangfangia sp. CPCC 101601]